MGLQRNQGGRPNGNRDSSLTGTCCTFGFNCRHVRLIRRNPRRQRSTAIQARVQPAFPQCCFIETSLTMADPDTCTRYDTASQSEISEYLLVITIEDVFQPYKCGHSPCKFVREGYIGNEVSRITRQWHAIRGEIAIRSASNCSRRPPSCPFPADPSHCQIARMPRPPQ